MSDPDLLALRPPDASQPVARGTRSARRSTDATLNVDNTPFVGREQALAGQTPAEAPAGGLDISVPAVGALADGPSQQTPSFASGTAIRTSPAPAGAHRQPEPAVEALSRGGAPAIPARHSHPRGATTVCTMHTILCHIFYSCAQTKTGVQTETCTQVSTDAQ